MTWWHILLVAWLLLLLFFGWSLGAIAKDHDEG